MQRPHMVIIQAVEREHFPIRPHTVLLRAGNDTPALLRLIENKIDVILGRREIRDKILDFAIEADEIKAAIVVDPRRRNETHRLFAKTFAVAGLVGHTDEVASVIESPRVIEALEKFRIALIDPTNIGAPMGATVVKHSRSPVAAAHPKERLTGYDAAPIVASVGNLGIVAEIEPAALKNIRLLQRRDLRRIKRRTVNTEESAGTVFVYELSEIHFDQLAPTSGEQIERL